MQYYRELIDSKLSDYLPPASSKQRLHMAMRYAVLNNAKRLRPIMLYLVGEALGVKQDQLDRPAAAVELIHCYSLVHDDLPAMDDDDWRRGRPSCHKAFDEATAILAGDALQSLAFSIIAAEQNSAMTAVLAKASGAEGMVLGQAQDLESLHGSLNIEQVLRLHSNKTAALIRASVELAVLAAKHKLSDYHNSLLCYAHNFGMAFQLQDDLQDATTDQTRKSASILDCISEEQARARLRELLTEAIEALRQCHGVDTSKLESLLRDNLVLDLAIH